MSTRAEHYRRAQELIADVDRRVWADRYQPTMTDVDRERVTLAQVHATLAAAPEWVSGELAPAEVAGEERQACPAGGVIHRAKLEEVLAELEELGDSPQPVSQTIRSIRRWVFGAEAGQ